MNNEKKAPVLTLEHLAPYLPYETPIMPLYRSMSMGLGYNEITLSFDVMHYFQIEDINPILRPLSEYKDINSKSMNNLDTDLQIQVEIWDLANKKIAFQSISYGTAMECFANHIDIFGLIDKGLAIDINSIEGKETKGNG